MSVPQLRKELKDQGMIISTDGKKDKQDKLELRLRLLLPAEDTWRFVDDLAQHGAAHDSTLPARRAAANALVGAPAV